MLAEKGVETVEERGRGEGLEAVDHWRRERRNEQGNHFLKVFGGFRNAARKKKLYSGSGPENENQALEIFACHETSGLRGI